jgi:hypothetical protein
MKPLTVEVITYAPTAFYHCQHCEVAFQEMGIGERLRRADAATALRGSHHQRDRRGAIHVDLRVDECHRLASHCGDPAGPLAHGAATMLPRWIGDQTGEILRPVASSQPAKGLGIVEPRSDRTQQVRGEWPELDRRHPLRRASASAVVGAHFTF